MESSRWLTDHGGKSSSQPYHLRRSMSTTQLIIVSVLSLAVVALLMIRQRQIN
jgi:hypothetical protein